MEYVIKIIIPTEPYWLPLKPPCVCAYVMFLEKKKKSNCASGQRESFI